MHSVLPSGIVTHGAVPAFGENFISFRRHQFEKDGAARECIPSVRYTAMFRDKFSSGLKFLVPQQAKVAFLELCGAFPEPKCRRLRIND
jgi:hypothetical protein